MINRKINRAYIHASAVSERHLMVILVSDGPVRLKLHLHSLGTHFFQSDVEKEKLKGKCHVIFILRPSRPTMEHVNTTIKGTLVNCRCEIHCQVRINTT